MQDEIDHNRSWSGMECECVTIGDHRHHRIGCDAWRRLLVAEANEPGSPAGPS